MARIHIAARIVALWNSPPGATEPTQKMWMPTRIPNGGSSRARNASTPSGSSRCGSPGRPPQKRSGASDQMPTSASSSTTVSSSVSIARYAIRTAVTGLPRPVSARCAAARGASVGAGVGRQQHNRRRAPPRRAASTSAAATRSVRTGASRPCRPLGAAQAGGRGDQQPPVTPLPIAASVSATSGAARRTQTSASSSP